MLEQNDLVNIKKVVTEALKEYFVPLPVDPKPEPIYDTLGKIDQILETVEEQIVMNKYGAVSSEHSKRIKELLLGTPNPEDARIAKELIADYYFIEGAQELATNDFQRYNIHYNCNKVLVQSTLLGGDLYHMIPAATYKRTGVWPWVSYVEDAAIPNTKALRGSNPGFVEANNNIGLTLRENYKRIITRNGEGDVTK